MAEPSRIFAFRRALQIEPVIVPVTSRTQGSPVAIPQQAIRDQGATSFKVSNPNPFWVWYRGWNGAQSDMPAIAEKGHFLAPGATDLNTSQVPQWIAAVACDEPGVPAPANAQGVLTTPGRIVLVYGAGI